MRDKANLTRWQKENYKKKRQNPTFRQKQSDYALAYYYRNKGKILNAKKVIEDEDEITLERIERMKIEIKEKRLERMRIA